ncbi:hypothetical protein J1N35_018813 [Gossypium stocksii]|uniref:Uncharacterized protein n=1 Tax=Gossypium stocksii TaxID=47602 RepID=A0A9D4A7J7_9ROSI|nr:hypothetical protein J1N35_018813 [Gossypium stocksii]
MRIKLKSSEVYILVEGCVESVLDAFNPCVGFYEASVSVHIERTTLDISVNFSSSKDCRETSLRMLILTVNSFHNPKLLSQYVLGLFHSTVLRFHEERHIWNRGRSIPQ